MKAGVAGIMYRSKKSAESPFAGTTEKKRTGAAIVSAQNASTRLRARDEQRDDAEQREHREVVEVVPAGRDEVQRVLPHRPARERAAAAARRCRRRSGRSSTCSVRR